MGIFVGIIYNYYYRSAQLELDRRFGARGREKGKLAKPKGKRGKVGNLFWSRTPLSNQTARTPARTNETKRNNFPVGLIPQPPIKPSAWFAVASGVFSQNMLSVPPNQKPGTPGNHKNQKHVRRTNEEICPFNASTSASNSNVQNMIGKT